MGPISLAPMAASSSIAKGTELLIDAPKVRYLPTRRSQWGPTSFAPMGASSRIDRGDRAANPCAEGTIEQRHLPTWSPSWGPTNFTPMWASSFARLPRRSRWFSKFL